VLNDDRRLPSWIGRFGRGRFGARHRGV